MTKQLDLFEERPRYEEYVDKYLNRMVVGTFTISYLFKKHCGEQGVLNPTEEHIKEKIFNDLANYGGWGTTEDILFHKYCYKHIVNMYYYVIGQEDNIQPIQNWWEQISI